jgi:hypothetical protein
MALLAALIPSLIQVLCFALKIIDQPLHFYTLPWVAAMTS